MSKVTAPRNKLVSMRTTITRNLCSVHRQALADIANKIVGKKDAYSAARVNLMLDEPHHPILLSIDLKVEVAPGATVEALLMADVCPFTFSNLEYVSQGNGPYPSLYKRTVKMVALVYPDTVKIKRGVALQYDDVILAFAKQCSKLKDQLKWTTDPSWPSTGTWKQVLKELDNPVID